MMIRKEFELQQDVSYNYSDLLKEELFDDFTCACRILPRLLKSDENSQDVVSNSVGLGNIVTHHGRIFLTEDHLCFSSNIFGVKSKQVSCWCLMNEFRNLPFQISTLFKRIKLSTSLTMGF